MILLVFLIEKLLCFSWLAINSTMYLQAQIDGKVVRAKFTLPERKKVTSPPKAVATTSRRDASKAEDAAADGDKDGVKRPREGEISF